MTEYISGQYDITTKANQDGTYTTYYKARPIRFSSSDFGFTRTGAIYRELRLPKVLAEPIIARAKMVRLDNSGIDWLGMAERMIA